MIIPRVAIADASAVAAHYDDLDDLYRQVWGSNLHHGYWATGRETTEEAVTNLTHLVARAASLRPSDRVCDIGCGYGAMALTLAREYGAVVTGITISTKQFQQAIAASRGTQNVHFLLGDALQNGLSSASFDVVITVESSEHFAHKAKLFGETHRLLRPGGRLVVAAWLTRARPHHWESSHLLEPICHEGRLPSLASADEYRRLLADAGFRNLTFVDLTRFVKKTWSVCALRFIQRLVGDSGLRRRMLDPSFTNRVFAKTLYRIALAYQIGAMRYGLFTALK